VAGPLQQAARGGDGRRGCGDGRGRGGRRRGGTRGGAHCAGELLALLPVSPLWSLLELTFSSRLQQSGLSSAACLPRCLHSTVLMWPRHLLVCWFVCRPLQVDPGEHYGQDAAAAGSGGKRPTGALLPWRRPADAAYPSLPSLAPCQPWRCCCSSCCINNRASADLALHACCLPVDGAGKVIGVIKRNWRTRGYCGSLQVAGTPVQLLLSPCTVVIASNSLSTFFNL
jgi:hypothetical protein